MNRIVIEGLDTTDNAYIRRVILTEETIEGVDTIVSNAWSIHKSGEEEFRGCATHPGLDDHIARAREWVNYDEFYFF